MQQNQKLFLRKMCHDLKPLILLGKNGLTDNILKEIDLTIEAKELIKVKLNGVNKEENLAFAKSIEEKTHSTLVQLIGNTGSFYRKSKEEIIKLPK
ncbi:MAG: ribosome assembly RNA-binding protein YhbY [Psittacicella sp.]